MMEQSVFAQKNVERAMESANFGLTWTREFAEQTLNQSKAALDGLLKVSDKIAKTFESQSSTIREQATVLSEKALSNSIDFGQKVCVPKNLTNWYVCKLSLWRNRLRYLPNRPKSQARKFRAQRKQRTTPWLMLLGRRSSRSRAL